MTNGSNILIDYAKANGDHAKRCSESSKVAQASGTVADVDYISERIIAYAKEFTKLYLQAVAARMGLYVSGQLTGYSAVNMAKSNQFTKLDFAGGRKRKAAPRGETADRRRRRSSKKTTSKKKTTPRK